MSQDPKGKLQSNGYDFTKTLHHDTYDYIKPEQFNLKDRAVLITGASKGVGKHVALSYAKAGATYIALGARSDMSAVEQEMQDAAKKVGKAAPTILSLKLDVTDKSSVAESFRTIEQKFGRLDIVINNAGYLESFTPIADSDPEHWWRVYEVNTLGTYLVARAALPLLLKTKDSLKTILNVSSIGAHITPPGGSGYCTGKLALTRFSEFIGAEYGDKGVLSYAVHPGGVDTELARGMPEHMHGVLIDQPALAGDTFVWLTAERRQWLAGRYVASTWDMEELSGKREKIEMEDLLKVRLDVGREGN